MEVYSVRGDKPAAGTASIILNSNVILIFFSCSTPFLWNIYLICTRLKKVGAFFSKNSRW